MARLNDVPIGSETIESLKRRFVRQNREIARANSIQSLRIRNLESEAARLLAENCDLREEITSLQAKLEKYESSRLLDNDILDFRQQFEAKLKEMNDLVIDLGRIPNRRSSLTKDNRSPNEAGHAAAELFHQKKLDREGLSNEYANLPVIQEDLGFAELTDTNPAEPELSRLAQAEDIAEAKIATELSSNVESHVNDANGTDKTAPAGAIIPLDGDAQPKSDPVDRIPAATVDDHEQNEQPQSIEINYSNEISSSISTNLPTANQPAAKDITISTTDENDDFQFTRTGRPGDGIKQKSKPRKARASTGRKRNILKPKSTNPKVQPPSNDDTEGFKIVDLKKLEASTDKSTDVVEDIHPEPEPVATPLPVERETDQILECNISGIDNDLTANDTTQTSETQEVHTPPPQMSTSASVLASTSRPSRRSRPAVSYAEPNLRAKMRRPTKELVGAVEGERASRRSSTFVVEELADSHISTTDSTTRERRSVGTTQPDEASTEATLKRTESDLMPPPVNARVSKKRKTSSSNGKEASSLASADGKRSSVLETGDTMLGKMDSGDQLGHDSIEVEPAARAPLENATIATKDHHNLDQESSTRHPKASESKRSAKRPTRASGRVVKEKRESDHAEGEEVAEDITLPTWEDVTETKPERRMGTRRRTMLV